jgi:hypothetical protein
VRSSIVAGAMSSEILGLCLLALAFASFLVESWEVQPHIDDAYISYRYAANWAAGNGLVFNPGEYVEGYTNPLWVLLIGIGLSSGLEAKLAGHILGLASGGAAMAGGYLLARALLPLSARALAGLVPLLLLASAGFVRWSTSGLETALFAACIAFALTALVHERRGWCCFALVLTTFARPEGVLLAAVVLAFALHGRWRDARAWGPALVYGAAVAAHYLFRFAYYGSWLPNTFHAKVGITPASMGFAYVGEFLSDGAAFLLLPAAFAAFALERTRAAAAFLVLFTSYVVYVGGDILGESRFLVPILPTLAALAVSGMAQGFERSVRLGAVGALLIATCGGWLVLGPSDASTGSKRRFVLAQARLDDAQFERRGRSRASVLRERGDDEVLVAAAAIGSLAYYSQARILDILGLVDPVIARSPAPSDPDHALAGHARSDPSYVLSREPDYILIRRRNKQGVARLRAIRDLWAHPDFEDQYRWDPKVSGYRRLR